MKCPHCGETVETKQLPTERQLDLLKEIDKHVQRYHIAPRFRELAVTLNRSTASLHARVTVLRRLHLVDFSGLVLTPEGQALMDQVKEGKVGDCEKT